MSLSTRFLSLSMKEQICITIIALTIFCIGVILIVCCSLMYEILMNDYEQKKLYFYQRYKEYIQSSFYFQNFYLMQYEEIIHRMQKQTWRIQQASSIYQSVRPIQNYSPYIKNMSEKYHNYTEYDLTYNKDMPYFYIISLAKDESDVYYIKLFTLQNYQLFSNSIITHDIYDYFRIPGYNIPIVDKHPLFYNRRYLAMFGFDHKIISDKLKELNDSLKEGETLAYILNETLIQKQITFINSTEYYMKLIIDKLDIFSQMFNKFWIEINSYSPEIFKNINVMNEYSDILASYISSIDYGNDNISILSTDTNNNFFLSEMGTIKNLLFFLNHNMTYSLDMDFIPLNLENHKILSPDLCSLFKFKQKFLSGKDFSYDDIYKDIHKFESNIENCLIEPELLYQQEAIKDIFDFDIGRFIDSTNLIFQGIFNLIPEHEEYPFYFMKYSFPNYNSLKEFQSEYLISNQTNFYSFSSFKKAQKYVEHIYQVTLNIFYFIIMVIIYSWLICLFINLIIFFKVIDEWTQPIIKLQEAVESNNIKDESIFNYKYDDIINELFLTCKELLTGQVDNSENGLKNFNILGKEKDNKIDKNIYKKNIIINNEIMQELINKQQSMLDFSNNIKINEPNNINSDNPSIDFRNRKTLQSPDSTTKNEENEKKNLEKIKAEKKKENEPYINLFKIAEYLQYYRSKLDTNNIIFINNEADETKVSKINSKYEKSIKSSVSNQTKKKNDENNDYINMLDEKNISYLWYMEAKKKYKNFNYNISSDYRELFTEFNDSYKNIPRSEIKRSIYHKKDKSP